MDDARTTLPERRRAIAALVIINAFWGCSFPIMKCLNLQVDQHFSVTEQTASHGLRAASASWMIAIRFGFSFILLCVLMRGLLRRVHRRHFVAGVAIGSAFFCGAMFQVIGLATIPASRSGFLTSLSVVFTPLMSTIYRRRFPRVPIMLAIVVALAGVAILTGAIDLQDGRVALADDAIGHWHFGDTMTTMGAILFSVQILLVDSFGKRLDSEAFTPSMFATTSILAALFFASVYRYVPETMSTNTDAASWNSLASGPQFFVLIAILCIFPSLLAFTWMNRYQPAVSSGQAAVIYTLEPVFASLWAMVLPGVLSMYCGIVYSSERFSGPLVVGGALVLAANALALWPEKRSQTPGD